MPNRPASRPMATWTVMGRPSSRAIFHSCVTTSSTQKPGPRVASCIVSRPSFDEKYRSRTRREGVQDLDKMIVEGGIRRAASNGALPSVPVRVDQSRDDDVPGDVDDLGVRLDVGGDLHDLVALDQDVAFRQVTNIRIHRDHGTAA